MSENEKELLAALKKAVAIIEQWHNYPAIIAKWPKKEVDSIWGIYFTHAPEMKSIRDTLKKFAE